MTNDGKGQGARGKGGLRLACSCLLPLAVLSCVDPRARPAAPILQVDFAASFRLTSPGVIVASLYAFDVDGLRNLDLSVRSTDTALVAADSALLLTGEIEVIRSLNWVIPAGLTTGSSVALIARVVDFEGFASADTVLLTVQDSVSALR